MANLQSEICPHCQYSLEGAPAQEQCFPLAVSLQRIATAGCLHLEFGWPNGVLDLQRSSVPIRLSGPVGSVLLSSHTDASCYIFMWELCARLHFLAGPPGLASASAPIQWCFAEERSMGKSAPEEHIQQSSDLRVPSAHLTGGVHGQLVPAGTAHAQHTREVSGVGAVAFPRMACRPTPAFQASPQRPCMRPEHPGAGRM